jgi:hypothetical protein
MVIKWERCTNCGKKLDWNFSRTINFDIGERQVIRCPGCHAVLNEVGNHWVDLSNDEKIFSHVYHVGISLLSSIRLPLVVLAICFIIFGVESVFPGLITLTVLIVLFVLKILSYIGSIQISKRIKPHPDPDDTTIYKKQLKKPLSEDAKIKAQVEQDLENWALNRHKAGRMDSETDLNKIKRLLEKKDVKIEVPSKAPIWSKRATRSRVIRVKRKE